MTCARADFRDKKTLNGRNGQTDPHIEMQGRIYKRDYGQTK